MFKNKPVVVLDGDNIEGKVRERTVLMASKRGFTVVCVWANPVPVCGTITFQAVKGEPDSSDDLILDLVQLGDIVITSDRDLADLATNKGCHVLDPKYYLPGHRKVKVKKDRSFTNELAALLDRLRAESMASVQDTESRFG